jgi:glycine C-acetyltransferase
MYQTLKPKLVSELKSIQEAGLYKEERIITTPQGAVIKTTEGKEVINFCANNYLGLSSHPKVIEAAKKAIDEHGYGMSSVRFICGTQDIHKELEEKISKFLRMEDTILYAAAFDANGGVFEPLLGPEDAIISDALNHASIIDGVRLCKAMRYRYNHSDMSDLEEKLREAEKAGAKQIMIVTDGVFSMDGTIAKLDEICDLAEKYGAIVMSDECHSTGFMGRTGRGVHEYRKVMDRVDIITGTLGKALGGASGGFTSGKKEIIDILRQRSRPYLFSNTLAPSIVGASIAAGFDIKPGEHPITPIMLYDAVLSQQFAAKLLEKGIYVIGFYFPVVPKGQARIRVQISAAHRKEHLDHAITAFTEVGKELKVLE